MSLAQLEAQIDSLRSQAASIQDRLYRTRKNITNDGSLSDTGKAAKLDAELEKARAELGDLRKKETELIAAKKQSLEQRLFGLSSITSSTPGQIVIYRDAQDRAARLTVADDAHQVFAAAMRSGDKTLAAAVLGRALEANWNSIVDAYRKQNPAAGEDLDDLARIQDYDTFSAGLSYITT